MTPSATPARTALSCRWGHSIPKEPRQAGEAGEPPTVPEQLAGSCLTEYSIERLILGCPRLFVLLGEKGHYFFTRFFATPGRAGRAFGCGSRLAHPPFERFHLNRGDVRLVSRRGIDHTAHFAELAQAIASIPRAMLTPDGEVAVFDEQLVFCCDLLSEPDPEVLVTPSVYKDAWNVGVLDELAGVGR